MAEMLFNELIWHSMDELPKEKDSYLCMWYSGCDEPLFMICHYYPTGGWNWSDEGNKCNELTFDYWAELPKKMFAFLKSKVGERYA